MSAFTGPQRKGATRDHRATKRAEAEARNAATPWERRASARRPCPTGKTRYRTEQEARTELVGCLVAKNAGRNQRKEVRVYGCPLCGAFHLTSKPYDPERAA